MPSIVPTRLARSYHHAADLPLEVWHALSQNEAPGNIISSFARKAKSLPRGSDARQLWIALFDGSNNVEFILSCTTGPLGDYPIFIVASKSAAQLAIDEKRGKRLADALSPLVLCLLEEVPPERVFSVFSVAQVTQAFAALFEACVPSACGVRALERPYYDATFTYCTRETLRRPSDAISSPSWSEDVVIALCRAEISHLEGVKAICKGFSETSPPFVLDDARAEIEARSLIENRQTWVHLVQKDDEAPEIACLVATTRESDDVSTVTKVFTAAHWRGRGCAARLLYRVCDEILQKKKRVVLYVGNSDDLAPARKVYHKIGFQGLNVLSGQQVRDVERWVEIGFTGTNLGYW